jgi:hypothetical protein
LSWLGWYSFFIKQTITKVDYQNLKLTDHTLFRVAKEKFYKFTTLMTIFRLQFQQPEFPLNIIHGVSGGLLQKVSRYNPAKDDFDIAYPVGIILEKKHDNKVLFSLRLNAVFD